MARLQRSVFPISAFPSPLDPRLSTLVPRPSPMSTVQLLQSKAAQLSEPVAAEVLDFLEFVLAKQQKSSETRQSKIARFRGALKGQLSSTLEFSAAKSEEIRREG